MANSSLAPLERRQLRRLIRNAKHLEEGLFDLTQDLQDAMHEGAGPFDWAQLNNHLAELRDDFLPLLDLVSNTQKELPAGKAGAD